MEGPWCLLHWGFPWEIAGEILRRMRDLCLANITESRGSMQIQWVSTFVSSLLFFFHSFYNFIEHLLYEDKSLGLLRYQTMNPQSFYTCHTYLLLPLGTNQVWSSFKEPPLILRPMAWVGPTLLSSCQPARDSNLANPWVLLSWTQWLVQAWTPDPV